MSMSLFTMLNNVNQHWMTQLNIIKILNITISLFLLSCILLVYRYFSRRGTYN